MNAKTPEDESEHLPPDDDDDEATEDEGEDTEPEPVGPPEPPK